MNAGQVADHVLLTRFNLPTRGVEGLIRAREGWLEERLRLFERFTAPSVAMQTLRPTWLVYLDPGSPDWLLDRLRHWKEIGILTPILREFVDIEALREDLDRHVARKNERLLTTNLDNDDGLARDFCERLSSASSPSDRCVIYWPSGLIRHESELFIRTDRRNAFCSVLESWRAPVTSWSEYHNEFSRVMPVVELKFPPGWLQVVHGSNVSNRVRGRMVSPEPYVDRFGPGVDGVRVPRRTEVARDAIVGFPLRSMRDNLRAVVRTAGLSILGKDRYQEAKAALIKLASRG